MPKLKRMTGMRPPPNGYSDWRIELQRYLITAGTNGRKHADIVARMQNWIGSDEITTELEALRSEQKVQKFKPPNTGRGRAPVIWRATKLIMS